MKFLTRFAVSLLITFLSVYKIQAQAPVLSSSAKISLLTCGTGNELYSIYGHTALRIWDPVNQIDVVYNYGTFDFHTSNFYLKFIKGDLQYFVSTSSFADFTYAYVYDNRDIYEQVLNLTGQQKQRIFNELDTVLSSEKRFYTYKFIDRNCTTMVADLINQALPEKISTKIPDTEKTYRNILYGYLDNHFYENLGINLMFGLKTDKQSDKLFLPIELMQGVNLSKNNNGKLVLEEKTVFKKMENGEGKSLWNNYITFALTILLLIALSGKRKFQIIWLTLCGLLGLFFSLVGCYSFHKEVLWNYNVLLMNPVFLLLVFFIVKNNTTWIKRTIIISWIAIAVYTGFILLKVQLLMMLPLIVLNTLTLWYIWKNLPKKQ
ncbi:DUF4105 domain-containing protein [Flavobacterium sp. SM15]|uniref:Lnb N-terminal periplasmic domain-containing protein n=1 Tax=Flavobacterium sp. SM15 TaxID=2908005 RepID=UPI001EDACF0B|nr:DUF4105 domain-containing protein [Flavobacterium sp. SM15]MCG2611239.1 DUF4105 domain-containing protein [Flavobacterium sp. SM15]